MAASLMRLPVLMPPHMPLHPPEYISTIKPFLFIIHPKFWLIMVMR